MIIQEDFIVPIGKGVFEKNPADYVEFEEVIEHKTSKIKRFFKKIFE